MKKRLTKTLLKALQGPTEVRDDLVPGLVARVSQKGVVSLGARWKVGGRDHRQHIGRWPGDVSIDEARRQCRKLTAVPKARPKNPLTVAEATARWLSAQERQVQRGKKRASSVETNERHARLGFLPALGDVPLHALERPRVYEWLDSATGGPIINRQLASLRALLNWCLDRGLLESNPASRIRMPIDESPRDRVLNDDEIRRFWATPMLAPQHNAMKLCLVVGCRIGEAAGLATNRVTDGVWHLEAQKTKGKRPRHIPMSQLALEHVNRESVSESSIHQAWRRHRGKVGLQDVGSHDLRRTCSSRLVELGYPESTAGAVLGHAPQTVTGRHYAIVSDATAREALEQWSELLVEILGR